MKGDAFYLFVSQHLYPRWIKMEAEFPIVLVVDGYSAHKNTELFIWCKEHNVILLLLYPNSTHILQVLDIGIFGPLKCKYSEFYQEWKMLHPNDGFTELEFIKVLKATNDVVIKPETIINGWRASGLQPFEFSNVNLDILLTNAPLGQDLQDRACDEIINAPLILDNIDNIAAFEICDHQVHYGNNYFEENEDVIIIEQIPQDIEFAICEGENLNDTDTVVGKIREIL